MKEHDFEYLRDVLDDIRYWDTCPDDYKQRFEVLIKQIDEHRKSLVTLGLPFVSKNKGTLHTCECNEPDAVNVKICLECDGVTH